jgi:hypothetical protein
MSLERVRFECQEAEVGRERLGLYLYEMKYEMNRQDNQSYGVLAQGCRREMLLDSQTTLCYTAENIGLTISNVGGCSHGWRPNAPWRNAGTHFERDLDRIEGNSARVHKIYGVSRAGN